MNIRIKDIIQKSDFLDKKKFTKNPFLIYIYKILDKKINYSKNHNDSNSKSYKSIDKKKQTYESKSLPYNAWFEYEKLQPDKLKRYNYITFKRIVRVLLCEIILQIIINRRSWYISNIGYININTSFYKKFIVDDKIFNNIVRVVCNISYNKNTNNYIKRYSLKLNTDLKNLIKKEHHLQKKEFITFKPLIINSKP